MASLRRSIALRTTRQRSSSAPTILRSKETRRPTSASIGAGFTGIATALTLAERGYQVAVLRIESRRLGASGRNGGQIALRNERRVRGCSQRNGAQIDDLLWTLRRRGNEIVEERVRKDTTSAAISGTASSRSLLRPRQLTALAEERDEHDRRAVARKCGWLAP